MERGAAGAQDAGLLARDRVERRAQHLDVIERDAGHDREHRLGGIGGVETAAQTDLHHGDVDGLLGEVPVGGHGERFEVGRGVAQRLASDRDHPLELGGELVTRDDAAADPDALGNLLEMGEV